MLIGEYIVKRIVRDLKPADIQTILDDTKMIEKLELFFKALGDGSRIKILLALSTGRLSVQALEDITGMSQSATSHQLKILKMQNWVKSEKIGKFVFYSLCDSHTKRIIEQAMSHMNHE